MSTHQQTRGNSAFSLIELLVVIGIIGFLLTLLLPTLSRSLQRARQVKCVNNLRQLGITLQEFVSDNRFYPLWADAEYDQNDQMTNYNGWAHELERQFNRNTTFGSNLWDNGVWVCPSVSSGLINKGFQSYGYNAFGVGTNLNSLGLGGQYGFLNAQTGRVSVVKPAVKAVDVVSPSEMYAIGDGFHGPFEGNSSQLFQGADFLWRQNGVWGNNQTSTSDKRHQGKANVFFCDGHVESPTLKFLFEDTSDAALVRWNRDHLPHRERLTP